MSFDSLLGGEPSGNSKNRPERYSDFPQRPAPEEPNMDSSSPWFVSPEEPSAKNRQSKKIANRVISILLPVAGIVIIGLIVAQVIFYVVGIYE